MSIAGFVVLLDRFYSLVTEWKQFCIPSLIVLEKTMKQKLIFDGRNIYEREYLEENGFEYYKIG